MNATYFLVNVTLQSMIADERQTITVQNPPTSLDDLEAYIASLEDLDVAAPYYLADIVYV